MNELRQHNLNQVKALTQVLGLMSKLKMDALPTDPLRQKIAANLSLQLIVLAQSARTLLLDGAEISLKTIHMNAQLILASERMLIEGSNKFFYLVIDSADDEVLERRFAYYSLVASKNLKRLMESGGADLEDVVKIDNQIIENQNRWLASDPHNWPPFLALKQEQMRAVLNGDTSNDYIKSDFLSAIDKRLNPDERRHYQLLGNVAVHSSGFLLHIQEPWIDHDWSVLSNLASFALFNAARNLALHGLELINRFPEMGGKLENMEIEGLKVLARGIKNQNYLYV